MRFLFHYIFLMAFLIMICAMESQDKKRNSDKIEDPSKMSHKNNAKKYGKIHENCDDSDEENNEIKKKREKTKARRNKLINDKESNENDVPEDNVRKYSTKTNAQHEKRIFEENLVESCSKKPSKSKVYVSAVEDEKNKKEQRNKKNQLEENNHDSSEELSTIDSKRRRIGKKTKDEKKIREDDVEDSEENNNKMSRDIVDDDDSEERVKNGKIKKNKHRHQDTNSEIKFEEFKEHAIHKQNDREVRKSKNKRTKKKPKFTGGDADSAEEISNDDDEEENYDTNQGTKRSMDDSVEVDNSAEECYRSKGKNRRGLKDCESINGESPGDDSENNKKKSKFSIKYAHEKKKNIPTRDDNLVKKIHGIQKKSRGSFDDDDGDSDEDALPKRLHMLLVGDDD